MRIGINEFAGAVLLTTTLTVAFALSQAPLDAGDQVLRVYYLSQTEASSFNHDDGQMSAFWDIGWMGRDSLAMDYRANCVERCEISGPLDAHVVAKAGGTSDGLYIYLRVTDSRWRAPCDTMASGAPDALSLWFHHARG